jgi:adenine C2-methylase RlmN of 23S rRNA A2503 and tRNA A37
MNNLSITLNLTLHSTDAHKRDELAPHLTRFFNERLSDGTLNLIHTGDVFRFIDLHLCLSRRVWNLLNGSVFLEIDLVQTR